MNYTVSLLNTAADCQALINIALSEKENLLFRRTALLRQRQSASISSTEIEAELAAVIAELEALGPLIETLPEGSFKMEAIRKFKKSEYKRFLLEQRKLNYGVLALLQKEYDIACIEVQVTEADAFITALTDRMEEVD